MESRTHLFDHPRSHSLPLLPLLPLNRISVQPTGTTQGGNRTLIPMIMLQHAPLRIHNQLPAPPHSSDLELAGATARLTELGHPPRASHRWVGQARAVYDHGDAVLTWAAGGDERFERSEDVAWSWEVGVLLMEACQASSASLN